MNSIEIYKHPKQFAKISLISFSLIALLFFYIILIERGDGHYIMALIGFYGLTSANQYVKLKDCYFTYDDQKVTYKLYQSKHAQTIAFSDVETVDMNSKNITISSNAKEQVYQISLALLNYKEKQALKEVFAKNNLS